MNFQFCIVVVSQSAPNTFKKVNAQGGGDGAQSVMKVVDNIGDIALNTAIVTYGTSKMIFDNVNLRSFSYKFSGRTGFKASQVYKALKSTSSITAKVAKGVGAVGLGISLGVAGYEIATGTENTHTWVDLGMTGAAIGAGLIFGAAAAPAILVGGIIYGGFVIAGGEDIIDRNFGYK